MDSQTSLFTSMTSILSDAGDAVTSFFSGNETITTVIDNQIASPLLFTPSPSLPHVTLQPPAPSTPTLTDDRRGARAQSPKLMPVGRRHDNAEVDSQLNQQRDDDELPSTQSMLGRLGRLRNVDDEDDDRM